VAVSGNYQAGTWVTDFTDPANPVTVAWSDPPPLVPTQLGGAWSSYWYNNFVFESEITKASTSSGSVTRAWRGRWSLATSTRRPRSSPSAEPR